MTTSNRLRSAGNGPSGAPSGGSFDYAGATTWRDAVTPAPADGDGEAAEGDGLIPRRVTRKEIIYVTSQLSVMVDTGIALSDALDGIIAQEENPTLRRILREIKESVVGGQDLSTALARYPRLFDRTYVSLVRVSEATGTMGEMLDRVARYLRRDVETRGKVRSALAYPTVMMFMAIGVTVFLLTYVLPKFTPLFERRGIDLPTPTVVIMSVSRVLMDYWYLWVAGGLAAVATFVFGRRTETGSRIWDWIKIHVPVVGTMSRKVAISRSMRTLGTMLQSGVPLLDAVRHTAEVAGNCYYERLWLHVAEQMTEGSQIHTALAGNPLFPRVLVQMISSGESTGKLPLVLERISNYYDQEVETSLKTVTSLIEPLMIVVMGVLVGGIALGLLLPIFQLSSTPG